MTRYKHTQVGYLNLVALGASCLAGIFWLLTGRSIVAAVVLAFPVLAMVVFSTLTIVIDDEMLCWYFSLRLFRKCLPLRGIRSCATVRNPMRYGWGIRRTPYGMLYNVSGLEAVEIQLESGERVRIGSDEASLLCGVITRILGQASAS